jgi:hypothetical protein
MAKTPVIDPWLTNADGTPDPFAQAVVDYGMTSKDEVDPDLLADQPGPTLTPEIIGNQPSAPSEEPIVEPQPPAPEPEPEGPEVFEVEDGTVTMEKEKGQWKAVLVNKTGGNPQIYWGKTRNELFLNMAKAQLNATAKIRELNKKVRTAKPAPPPVPQTPTPTSRQLTADEAFEIKALWESDPAAALDKLVKLRTNLTLEDLVAKAQRGEQASFNLDSEAVAKEFLARNPDYYSDPNNQNFSKLIKWIGEARLGKVVTEGNQEQIFNELCETGNFTVDNLEAAFEDLSEEGKLVKPRAPKPSPPVEVLPEPVPAPASTTPRIVKTETRPRAALGIRPSDVSATPPPQTPTAPTDEDFNNLPDDELDRLLKASLNVARKARRSN